jgi:hypothetical protein
MFIHPLTWICCPCVCYQNFVLLEQVRERELKRETEKERLREREREREGERN